ncbi:hypothetical protein RhiirA5_430090 [Rhizophagus irregularis]|nr:hypothetical protein RhiirA5_430090 [Rhizophagus irregularis]PKC60623.1 hypothetical protein RhiirA1_539712 [Rhizophagus irregularis]PKY31543.1 hypothetical protein RhiirB3_449189 [Rhizophagus irregularis]CAB4494515.1 unnamed protein product [Rhizophagus irregularis]
MPQHPESVPINALVQVEGTGTLEETRTCNNLRNGLYDFNSSYSHDNVVRLSAGRARFSQSEQALCFFAGANSIFTGDKLLATNNNVKKKFFILTK